MVKSPKTSSQLVTQAGKNRLKQIARTGVKRPFDARRRAVFLEWFAATCNVKLAAEMADVRYHTVYWHRRRDSAFAEAWDEALAQGYAALEASLLADALADEVDRKPAEEEAQPIISPLSFEQRMALLKEYRRRDGGHGPRPFGKPPTIEPRIATVAEAEAALIKRLKHFAMRVAEADAEGRTVLDPPGKAAKSGIPITKQGGGPKG